MSDMDKDILTAQEAADYLRIGINALRRLVASGAIPAAKLDGTRHIFSRRQLLEHVEKLAKVDAMPQKIKPRTRTRGRTPIATLESYDAK